MSTERTYSDVEELPFEEGEEEEGGFSLEEEEPEILYSEDFISRPFTSEGSELPEDILDFDFSYGYDCKRFYNLVCMEENIVVFASGNIIHFFNVETKELWFRRSFLGGGIGHITRNPNVDYPHMTIAENGEKPPIIIYEWPSLDIVSVLKDGAAKRYAHCNYSPDGKLLASQSYGPDFLITIWNWKRSSIILRVKSHVIDVDVVMFSPYVPGQITTGGSGHIKFWKMAQTFTGLKLQGELGRFGKTEISDILGIFPMPDEKVLSGSEWGNILVWEAGLIKCEVLRTSRRNCHKKPIVQFLYIEGELWSISMDGWCRAWNYKFIDEADPPDDDRVVLTIVSFERQTPDLEFMSISKMRLEDPQDLHYYAQDGNGGIWRVDLALDTNYDASVQLYTCHSGAVADIATCPWGDYLASLGVDGRIIIYSYIQKVILYIKKFEARGVMMDWLPLSIDSSGSTIFMAFDDGAIRVCQVGNLDKPDEIYIKLIQVTKPHNKTITCYKINPQETVLVSGSEDKSIFVYCLQNKDGIIHLEPIGFAPVGNQVTCLTWHPKIKNMIFVGGLNGEVWQFEVPDQPQDYTEISYLLNIKPIQITFTTIKSQIRRDIKIAEIEARKAKKLAKKREELAIIKANNPGLEIDEATFLEDSESEEELEPLFIPEVPNRVCFLMYTPEDTLWLSMGGYDAGYIYEYTMDQKEKIPQKSTIVHDGDDIEMHSYLYTHNGKYIILTFENGTLRLCRVNPKDFRDLKDYWQLAMHDNYNGKVNRIIFNHNSRYFFSCGNDGSIFSYLFNPEDQKFLDQEKKTTPIPEVEKVLDDHNYESLSLEEYMVKREFDKQMKLANDHKTRLRNRLAELEKALSVILNINCDLPKKHRIDLHHLIIDQRIMDALDEFLQAKIDLEKRKIAYNLEKSTIGLEKLRQYLTDPADFIPTTVSGLVSKCTVKTVTHRGLGAEYFSLAEIVQRKLIEEELKGKVVQRQVVESTARLDLKKKQAELEPFLVGLSPSTIEFRLGAKLTRLLNRYRARKNAQERREEEWAEMNSKKPIEGVNHPDDEKYLEEAKKTIGDFKLKSAPDYKVPRDQKVSTVKKFNQLINAREECFNMRHGYNQKVLDLRYKKEALLEDLRKKREKILDIQAELPEERHRSIPTIPQMTREDFPEKNLEVIIKLRRPAKKKKKRIEKIPSDFDFERELLAAHIHKINIPGTIAEICSHQAPKTWMLSQNISKKKLIEINENDSIKSSWENELLVRRLVRKIIEQDELIQEMESSMRDFDKDIIELQKERIRIVPHATLMELHTLLLHQEVIIIKEFEQAEGALLQIVDERTNEMMDMKDFMTDLQNQINKHNDEIERNNEKIKDVQNLFLNVAKDHKFWDFLRRIFRKKYKPPKIHDPDVEESSSSSSESTTSTEEEDAGSLDSREIGPIRLDESICPKGLERDLYDYTFELRSQRHDIERDIKERQKTIESIKKEMEQAAKKMRKFEANLDTANENLEIFQRERQQRLNQIECCVLMYYDQIKHFDIDMDFKEQFNREVLVFSKAAFTKLYKRVNELKVETLHQRASFRKNRTHLHRMTIDLKHMAQKIRAMKKKIVHEMKIKFGSRVDIDELEEAILRRLVMELRVAMLNIGEEYENQVHEWAEIMGTRQVELKDIIRENTARLDIYAALQHEKSELTKFLEYQSEKIEQVQRGDLRPDSFFTEDIDKLKNIVKMQQNQMQALRDEINSLTAKPATIPLMRPEEPKKAHVDQEEDVLSEMASLEAITYNYVPRLEMGDMDHKEKHVKEIDYTQEIQISSAEITQTITDIVDETVEQHLSSKDVTQQDLSTILTELAEILPEEYLEEGLNLTAQKLKSIDATPSGILDVSALAEDIQSKSKDKIHTSHPSIEELVSSMFEKAFEFYIA